MVEMDFKFLGKLVPLVNEEAEVGTSKILKLNTSNEKPFVAIASFVMPGALKLSLFAGMVFCSIAEITVPVSCRVSPLIPLSSNMKATHMNMPNKNVLIRAAKIQILLDSR